MKKLKLGKEFFIALFIAGVCSAVILWITYQEEMVDKACAAIENHENNVAMEYIDKIVDVNFAGTQKKTMLMAACQSGNAEMISHLVMTCGADPAYTIPGKLTPLELFCRDGYEAGEKTIQLLLEKNARVIKYTDKPPLFILANRFYWMTDEQKAIATEEAILLLKYGSPLGYQETSILHLAAKSNMADLFYTVVHSREGLYLMTMRDTDGNTPWDVAVKNGAVDVQKVIRGLEEESGNGSKDPLAPQGTPSVDQVIDDLLN